MNHAQVGATKKIFVILCADYFIYTILYGSEHHRHVCVCVAYIIIFIIVEHIVECVSKLSVTSRNDVRYCRRRFDRYCFRRRRLSPQWGKKTNSRRSQ